MGIAESKNAAVLTSHSAVKSRVPPCMGDRKAVLAKKEYFSPLKRLPQADTENHQA
jgi:hypothetical protein